MTHFNRHGLSTDLDLDNPRHICPYCGANFIAEPACGHVSSVTFDVEYAEMQDAGKMTGKSLLEWLDAPYDSVEFYEEVGK